MKSEMLEATLNCGLVKLKVHTKIRLGAMGFGYGITFDRYGGNFINTIDLSWVMVPR